MKGARTPFICQRYWKIPPEAEILSSRIHKCTRVLAYGPKFHFQTIFQHHSNNPRFTIDLRKPKGNRNDDKQRQKQRNKISFQAIFSTNVGKKNYPP